MITKMSARTSWETRHRCRVSPSPAEVRQTAACESLSQTAGWLIKISLNAHWTRTVCPPIDQSVNQSLALHSTINVYIEPQSWLVTVVVTYWLLVKHSSKLFPPKWSEGQRNFPQIDRTKVKVTIVLCKAQNYDKSPAVTLQPDRFRNACFMFFSFSFVIEAWTRRTLALNLQEVQRLSKTTLTS